MRCLGTMGCAPDSEVNHRLVVSKIDSNLVIRLNFEALEQVSLLVLTGFLRVCQCPRLAA